MDASQIMPAMPVEASVATEAAPVPATATSDLFDAVMASQVVSEEPVETVVMNMSVQEVLSGQLLAMLGNVATVPDIIVAAEGVDTKQVAMVEENQQQLEINAASLLAGLTMLQNPSAVATEAKPLTAESLEMSQVEAPEGVGAVSGVAKQVSQPVPKAEERADVHASLPDLPEQARPEDFQSASTVHGIDKPAISAEEVKKQVGTEKPMDKAAVNRLPEADLLPRQEQKAEGSKATDQLQMAEVAKDKAQDPLQVKSLPADPVVRSAEVTPSPVKFSQSADVVVATAQGGESKSSQNYEQGPEGQKTSQKGMDLKVKEVETEQLAEQPQVQKFPDQQVMHANRQAIAADRPEVVKHDVSATMPEQVVRQVAEKLVAAEVKGGAEQISLKLSPEHLGNLQMNLKMENQKLQVEIIAEHRAVRDAILQQADTLKETLSRQNIQVDSFDVTTGGGAMQQQFKGWRQMGEERQLHHPQYASNQKAVAARGFEEVPVRYFEKQYSSTIDLRF